MSKADELKSYMPPYLLDSNVLQQIFNAIGPELDNFNISKEDLFAQCFIDTATWGLDLWDQFAGTQTRQLDINERRNVIKVKLMTRPPCTKSTLLYILKNLTDDAEINENYAEYSFDVILKTKSLLGSKLNYIMEQLDLIKPAHLDYKIIIDYLTELIIKVNFSKYESDPFSYCGTLDTTGVEDIATDGRKYEDSFIDKVSKYFSTAFMVAAADTYSSLTDGYTKDEKMVDKCTKYFSINIPQCSTNIYCGGGVYS